MYLFHQNVLLFIREVAAESRGHGRRGKLAHTEIYRALTHSGNYGYKVRHWKTGTHGNLPSPHTLWKLRLQGKALENWHTWKFTEPSHTLEITATR